MDHVHIILLKVLWLSLAFFLADIFHVDFGKLSSYHPIQWLITSDIILYDILIKYNFSRECVFVINALVTSIFHMMYMTQTVCVTPTE